MNSTPSPTKNFTIPLACSSKIISRRRKTSSNQPRNDNRENPLCQISKNNKNFKNKNLRKNEQILYDRIELTLSCERKSKSVDVDVDKNGEDLYKTPDFDLNGVERLVVQPKLKRPSRRKTIALTTELRNFRDLNNTFSNISFNEVPSTISRHKTNPQNNQNNQTWSVSFSNNEINSFEKFDNEIETNNNSISSNLSNATVKCNFDLIDRNTNGAETVDRNECIESIDNMTDTPILKNLSFGAFQNLSKQMFRSSNGENEGNKGATTNIQSSIGLDDDTYVYYENNFSTPCNTPQKNQPAISRLPNCNTNQKNEQNCNKRITRSMVKNEKL